MKGLRPGALPSWFGSVLVVATSGAHGQALQLHNVAAVTSSQLHIKSPAASATSLMPPQLTVELWIQPTGPGFGQTSDELGADIAYRGDDIVPVGLTVASWVLRWAPATGQLNFQLNQSETVGTIWFSHAIVPVDTKAHVAMTFDGQRARLYVNGVLDVDEPWPFTIYYETDDAIWVGTGNGMLDDPHTFVRRFDGIVDSLRIWDHARTQAAIAASMHCGSLDAGDGLRGSWNFDDGSAHDASGLGNDGDLQGDWSIVPDFAGQQDCATAWTDRGFAKAGSAGLPHLVGGGEMTAGSTNSLVLAGAAPASTATLVVGLTEIDAPFKGGTLVPSVLTLVPLPTGALGMVALPFALPATTPPGVDLFFQDWIGDAAASHGLSASNGLQATTH